MSQEQRAWQIIMDKAGGRDILDWFAHDAEKGVWYHRADIGEEINRPWQTVDSNIHLLVDAGLVEEHPERRYEYRRPDDDEVDRVYETIQELDNSIMDVIPE